MPATTYLSLSDRLPLTCTRSGACCHGKTVWLNPWELARLAAAKGLTPRSFRDHHCEFGGIRLRFNSPPGWKGLAACSQYAPDCGCSVHAGRPLSCRLYPLGRERRGKELRYLHRGGVFPCLEECGDVVKLPHMTIADYLAGQDVMESIIAHDKYLELMQRLADGAFALLLESGLAASGDRLKKTILPHWWSLGIVAGFLVIGVGVKHLMNPDDTVVPGYFFFLACVAYTPMVLFYRVSRGFVNWQAFWFTLVVTVLASVIWEATLALPRGYWDYHHRQMLGIFIGPWHDLPIEAVTVWIFCTLVIIVYEFAKIVYFTPVSRTAKVTSPSPLIDT